MDTQQAAGEHTLSCRSSYMRHFLGVDTSSTMTKIYNKAGLDSSGTKGRERILTPRESRQILEHRKYDLSQPAKKVAFWVNKGGSGKTSISKLVSQFTATLGFKTLYIDTDSQGNATDTFISQIEARGIEIDEETPVLYDVLEGRVSLSDCLVKVDECYYFMPSTIMNQNIEDSGIRRFEPNTSKMFNKLLKSVENEFDYIFIDCAPNLGLLNTAIACASDMTVIMAHPHKFSMKGVRETTKTLHELEESFGIKIPHKILFNRYAKRNNLTHKVMSELSSEFSNLFLPIILSEKQEIAAAIEYDHNFFLQTTFQIVATDEHGNEKSKNIDYKTSPKEIADLTMKMLNLPELTLSAEKVVH